MRLRLKHLDSFVDRHGTRRYYVRLDGVRHAMPNPGAGQLPSDEFTQKYRSLVGEDIAASKVSIKLQQGTIYAAGYDRFVKIGLTTRPVAKRISNLNTGSPLEIKLYRTLTGTIRDEEALHVRFAAYRLRNEWFDLRGELQAWVRSEVEMVPSNPTQIPKVGRSAEILK